MKIKIYINIWLSISEFSCILNTSNKSEWIISDFKDLREVSVIYNNSVLGNESLVHCKQISDEILDLSCQIRQRLGHSFLNIEDKDQGTVGESEVDTGSWITASNFLTESSSCEWRTLTKCVIDSGSVISTEKSFTILSSPVSWAQASGCVVGIWNTCVKASSWRTCSWLF